MDRFKPFRPRRRLTAAQIEAININEGVATITLNGGHVPPGLPVRLEFTEQWVVDNNAETGGYVVDYAEGETAGYVPKHVFFEVFFEKRVQSEQEQAASATLGLLANTLLSIKAEFEA